MSAQSSSVTMSPMDTSRPACQIYAISPPTITKDFPAALESVLTAAPVAAFQLRLKGYSAQDIVNLARPLQQLCTANDTAFIVNDDITLAAQLAADGVHLGQEDGDPHYARQILGSEAQIGVTCHDSRHLALLAGEAGADYVAFGAFYPSKTKQTFRRATLDILRWWQIHCTIPSVAIGGITLDNAAPLAVAGANFVALSNAIWENSPNNRARSNSSAAAVATLYRTLQQVVPPAPER